MRLIVICIYLLYFIGICYTEKTYSISDSLERGQKAASAGDYAGAVEAYTKAIQMENEQYSVFYRRATVYLMWNKQFLAIHDLVQTLKLRPNWGPAVEQLASLYLKSGQLDDAKTLIQNALSDSASTERTDLPSLFAKVEGALALQSEYEKHKTSESWPQAYDILSRLLETSPQCVRWRLDRAEVAENMGQFDFAMADLSRASALDPSNANVFLLLSKIHMKLGDVAKSVSTVQDCLKSDPDRKECMKLYKSVKSFAKRYHKVSEMAEKGQWVSVLKEINGSDDDSALFAEAEELSGRNKNSAILVQLMKYQCYGSGTLKRWTQAIEKCSEALKFDENDSDALLWRADAYVEQDLPEDAINDYSKVLQLNNGNRRAMEGKQKAEALIRRRSMKDYYKILGVSRDATDREIKRAYRRAAQQWHPDKYQGDLSREQVEAKMAEVNQAYQVLSDPELKSKFDGGQDPFSQESHTQNPFTGFGSPFGGGGGGGAHHFFFQQGGGGGGGNAHHFFTNMFNGGN